MTMQSGILPIVPAAPALALLDGLYALMRAAAAVGADHPSLPGLADDVASTLDGLATPCSLQFLGAAVYCNRQLLPVDIERVAQVIQLARSLDAMGAQELLLDAPVTAATLLALMDVLLHPADRAGAQVPGVQWRALVGPVWGDAGKPVDRDVAARVWLARAAAMAERLDRTETAPWPWAESTAIVRRLEQAIALDPGAAVRALELAPTPWLPGRRAVAVALRTMLPLALAGVSLEVQRATGHAALAAAVHGFAEAQLKTFDLAARLALSRANLDPGVDAAVSARHRLQVAGLLQALAHRAGTGSAWPGPLPAFLVSWDIEARRADGVSAPRTTQQALADAEHDPYNLGGKVWLKVLIHALGITPPGAIVADAAGQVGVVLDATGRSGGGRPVLIAQNQMVQVQAPLRPILHDS